MEDIKVIVYGVSGVGSGIIRTLAKRLGVKIVAAVGKNPAKFGKDIGELVGVDPLGVYVESNLEEACKRTKADIMLDASSSGDPVSTFEADLPAIVNGINVIVANADISCLQYREDGVAQRIHDTCCEHGVSYLGIGNTQTTLRLIFGLAEGVADIESIRFTHFADVHSFSPKSNADRLGITLPIEEYRKRFSNLASGNDRWRIDVVYGIAEKFGWNLDDVKLSREIKTDDSDIVNANITHVIGTVGTEEKIRMDWVFTMDPEERYYDQVEIKGVPYVNSINNFSPDRGKVGTYASMCNAIPLVVAAKPGYISSFDLNPALPY